MAPRGEITVEHLWKRFRADRTRRLLRDRIERLGADIRRGRRSWRWALRDITFGAAPGESIGLVGANGSGKSTLLKILTRVMYPYAGRMTVGGLVGALIEVRAGIHPDLTGRENIFLYGSLLGLGRKKVARRFDEIVEFAELETAIDRQVKFYSSGMQMRLGFAVAAFLEPDVLLVDEVLAVGDASFQQRCLDRMNAVLAQGTTLIFVSHDLSAVEAVCERGIWLHDGLIQADGPVREVLSRYRHSVEEEAELGASGGVVQLVKAEVSGGEGEKVPRSAGPLDVLVALESQAAHQGNLYLGVSEGPATPIFVVRRDLHLSPGVTKVRCVISRLPLPRGEYYLWVAMTSGRVMQLVPWHPAARITVMGPDLDPVPGGVMRLAPVHVEADWELARG